MKILIADDDTQMLRALRVTLNARGYEIITASNGTDAVNAAIEHRPEMFMLDLGMPELDGIDVIHALRGWTQTPILVVSGRTGAADKVEALDAGADDYVTKPFSIDELLARIRALTRRATTAEAPPVIQIGNYTIDITAKSATGMAQSSNPERLRLTPTEWKVLGFLVKNAGKLVTRHSLLSEIWGAEHVTDTGYLRLYIAQLRKKLEPDPARPRYILTESGMGYRFEPGRSPNEVAAETGGGYGPEGTG